LGTSTCVLAAPIEHPDRVATNSAALRNPAGFHTPDSSTLRASNIFAAAACRSIASNASHNVTAFGKASESASSARTSEATSA
jgi:hypothetical protein